MERKLILLMVSTCRASVLFTHYSLFKTNKIRHTKTIYNSKVVYCVNYAAAGLINCKTLLLCKCSLLVVEITITVLTRAHFNDNINNILIKQQHFAQIKKKYVGKKIEAMRKVESTTVTTKLNKNLD